MCVPWFRVHISWLLRACFPFNDLMYWDHNIIITLYHSLVLTLRWSHTYILKKNLEAWANVKWTYSPWGPQNSVFFWSENKPVNCFASNRVFGFAFPTACVSSLKQKSGIFASFSWFDMITCILMQIKTHYNLSIMGFTRKLCWQLLLSLLKGNSNTHAEEIE